MLALLITVDALNVLHVYAMQSDQSELLFKTQIEWTDHTDYAVSCDFFLRAKAIFVTSRFGENIVVT